MKHSPAPQSATSLGASPRHEADTRVRQYVLTMAIRLVCIVLAFLIQPFGWYTWVFAVGAIFLPYVAVVIANVGHDSKTVAAVSPERQLETLAPPPRPVVDDDVAPGVFRIQESRPVAPPQSEDPAA